MIKHEGKEYIVTGIATHNEADKFRIEECITLLTSNGIKVRTKDRIHQKFAVIDQHIVWYGSINLLSYASPRKALCG